jgi:hypothetical protein
MCGLFWTLKLRSTVRTVVQNHFIRWKSTSNQISTVPLCIERQWQSQSPQSICRWCRVNLVDSFAPTHPLSRIAYEATTRSMLTAASELLLQGTIQDLLCGLDMGLSASHRWSNRLIDNEIFRLIESCWLYQYNCKLKRDGQLRRVLVFTLCFATVSGNTSSQCGHLPVGIDQAKRRCWRLYISWPEDGGVGDSCDASAW